MTTLYTAFDRGLAIARQRNGGWGVSFHLTKSYPECLAVDPLHPHYVFCGTTYQGLWRSTDAGTTWEQTREGIPSGQVTAVAVSGLDQANGTGVVYAGTEPKAVVERFGHLNILVNNAGIAVSGLIDNPENNILDFERQHAINFGGVVAAIRTAVKVMENGGRIITVGSVVGTHVGTVGMADYAATKAAIAGYTRGAARDLGPRNITVNVLQAGAIDTDMNPATGEFAPTATAGVALGRYGRPEEIAAGIVFLASPAASYITGTVLNVDGGYGA